MGVFLYFSFFYFFILIPVLLMGSHPLYDASSSGLLFHLFGPAAVDFSGNVRNSPVRKNDQCNNEACKFLENRPEFPTRRKQSQWNPQQSLQILGKSSQNSLCDPPPPATPHQWNNEVYKYLDKITMVKFSSGATKSKDSWIKIPWTKIPSGITKATSGSRNNDSNRTNHECSCLRAIVLLRTGLRLPVIHSYSSDYAL